MHDVEMDKTAKAPAAGDDSQMQELLAREEQVRREIHEREAILANIAARKDALRQKNMPVRPGLTDARGNPIEMRRVEPDGRVGGTIDPLTRAMMEHDRRVDQNQLPPPRPMTPGPNGYQPGPIGPDAWTQQLVSPLRPK